MAPAVAVFALAAGPAVAATSSPDAASPNAQTFVTVKQTPTPVFGFDAPDPDVVRDGRTYYAYTTGTTWGNHIGILSARSPQGPWKFVRKGPGGSTAFPKADQNHTPVRWQVNNTQIAPGVVHLRSRWVMYYAAQAKKTKRWCLSIATASAPAGPFVDHSTKPFMCLDALGGAVDPSPFVDATGRPWLVWKSNAGAAPTQPARIWSVPLRADGLRTAGFPALVMTQRTGVYPWETTVENPQMVLYDGAYYLFFSGGKWDSPNYAEGYAVCNGPAGPCIQRQFAPFLTSFGSALGPGGATMFVDADGAPWLAFHAWTTPCTSYSCFGERQLYVVPLRIAGVGIPCVVPATRAGYRLVAADGGLFDFGNAKFCGSTARLRLGQPITATTTSADGGGYWLATSGGSVYAFGDAQYLGSVGAIRLRQPVVGMAATPDRRGYWLATGDGRIFRFGDAPLAGSASGTDLKQPIVGMAAKPDGRGYWMVARDGGIFAFGGARFYGSTGAIHLNQPIVGMASTPHGKGYWLVARDGGIFAFGDAPYYGSTGGKHLHQPIIGMG